MLNSSASSFPAPPTLDPKMNEAHSLPSATPYASTVPPTTISVTPPSISIPNTAAPTTPKSKTRASSRFRSNATPADVHSVPPATHPPSLHEVQHDVGPISGTSSRVAALGTTSATGLSGYPRLPESGLGGDEGWDLTSPGSDPFRANSLVIPAGLASRSTVSRVSTPALPITNAPATLAIPTSAGSQQSLQSHSTSSRLGAKIHHLLHSRSARTLKETVQYNPALAFRAISDQIGGDAAASSSNLGGRPRAKSFGSRQSTPPTPGLPAAETAPLPIHPIINPLPAPPNVAQPGSGTSAPLGDGEYIHLDHHTERNEGDAADLMSSDELVIGTRLRGDNGPKSPSVMSSTSGVTATGTRSILSASGVTSSPEPSTPTSVLSRTFVLNQPRPSALQSRSRSRSNSAAAIGSAPRPARPPSLSTSLSASVGPDATSITASSSASMRAMRTKRSMPELDGVWKGFLEEIEEDAAVLLPSAHGTTNSVDGGSREIKTTGSATSNRRPRRATMGGTTAVILSSSPPPPTPHLPPVPLPPSSSVGSRRPHVPPRLSLSSSTLSATVQNPLPTPAMKSTAPSVTSWVLPRTPSSASHSQPHLSTPFTPPFTPSSDDTSFPQSTRPNRPVSTATASSAHTIKARRRAIPDAAPELVQSGFSPASSATSTFQSEVICPHDGSSVSTAALPMIRQESANSRRSVSGEGQAHSDGAQFVGNDISAHEESSYHFLGSADDVSVGSNSSPDECKSFTKSASHLNFGTTSTSRPGSSSAWSRYTHSRAASSLSLTPSVNSASRPNIHPFHTSSHSFGGGSQASVRYGAPQRSTPTYGSVSSRSSSSRLVTSTNSSNNDSTSLLSWHSDSEDTQDDLGDFRMVVANSTRSRASSRVASLIGDEMEPTMAAVNGHTLYHLPSRPVVVSPPMSPIPNSTPELSPHGRHRQSNHTRQSSLSSLSSLASSFVSAGAYSTKSRTLLPISTKIDRKIPSATPLTPPKSATPSPTLEQLTPSSSRRKPLSASTPPAYVTTPHTASRQHDAELLRAVRALEAEAEIAILAATGGAGGVRVKNHQSLTPVAAKSLARMMHSGERFPVNNTLNRPETHVRSRSHDLLASTPAVQSLPSRDRSASHPHIGDELGYAI